MPELDCIRGLAALSVLFYHGIFWTSGGPGFYDGLEKCFILATKPGWLGVNLFFILSGFLITGILLNSKTRKSYYSRFYIRRALRILPAYYLLLLVLFFYGISRPFLGLSVIYLSNIAPLLGVGLAYGPLWSLAVEEHFYLIWPMVIRKCSTRTIGLIAALVVIVTPVLRGFWFRLENPGDIYFLTWLVCDGLATGALIGIFLRSRWGTRRNTLRLAIGLAVCGVMMLCAGFPFGIMTRKQMFGAIFQFVPWNFLFGSMLVFSLLLGSSRYKKFAQPPLLPFMGKISYGLYLIHVFVFTVYDSVIPNTPGHFEDLIIRFVICAVVAIGVSALSRYTYEEWFLRLKGRFMEAQDRGPSEPLAKPAAVLIG